MRVGRHMLHRGDGLAAMPRSAWRGRAGRIAGGVAVMLLLLLWSAVQPAAAMPSPATFAQALRQIAAAHPQVRAAGLAVTAGQADIAAARAPRRPQVAIVGDVGYERSGLTARSNTAWLPGVRLTQLLYDGGRTTAEISRRRFRADALAADRECLRTSRAQPPRRASGAKS